MGGKRARYRVAVVKSFEILVPSTNAGSWEQPGIDYVTGTRARTCAVTNGW